MRSWCSGCITDAYDNDGGDGGDDDDDDGDGSVCVLLIVDC